MPVSERFDLSNPEDRETGVSVALAALARGELVVLPTDTVYGIACDAFTPDAVSSLLAAKGRGRDMPVPVLIGSFAAFRALVGPRGEFGDLLVDEFWPGPLTVICHQQPSVRWDLGDGQGTVAVRMPDDDLALELLTKHGPLAVSSANRSGESAATTCDEAREQLGDTVRVYLDNGPVSGGQASTIVDLTGATPRVVREGALSVDQLRDVVPELEADD